MTDDTALQAPTRPLFKRRDARPLGETAGIRPALEVPPEQRIDKRVTCSTAGCRRKVHLTTDDLRTAIGLQIVTRQAAGEIPAFCGPCTDEIDRLDAEAEYAEERGVALATRLRGAHIPERWANETWTAIERDPERRAAIETAERWSQGGKGSPSGVLLWGEVGRGKTHIAAVAAIERCNIGPVKWLNMAELIFALSRPMGDPKRARAMDVLDPSEYANGVALVLDDLDKIRATDFGIQPVYLAVNAWVEARQPLFVTTNVDLDRLAEEMGDRYGDAIASRLAGYCSVHEVGGPDRRLE